MISAFNNKRTGFLRRHSVVLKALVMGVAIVTVWACHKPPSHPPNVVPPSATKAETPKP